MRILRGVPLAAAVCMSAPGAFAQPCSETWFPQFINADFDNQVRTMLEREEGNQSVLYIGGDFGVAGGVTAGLVRWDGIGYSAVGAPALSGVYTLVCFDDDGPGPNPERLCAGGQFTGVVNRTAMLVNGTWEQLGTPWLTHLVRSLVVFDDGGGAKLYAAGGFDRVYRLAGTAWEVVGTGMTGVAHRLAVFDEDGPGPGSPALFALGDAWSIGGETVTGIARWNGIAWSKVGGSITPATGRAMEVHDEDGPGPGLPALYIGGSFQDVAGVACANAARWDGAQWSALGPGIGGAPSSVLVLTMRSIDEDGAGPGMPGLYVGGQFMSAGGQPAQNVAVWRSGAWSAFQGQPNNYVNAIEAVRPTGEPPTVLMGGTFQTPAAYIARLSGATWRALSEAVVGTITRVGAFTLAGESRLYFGGQFTAVGGGSIPAAHVAAWDGEQWHPLGSGVNGDVMSFTLHDRGGGPELYAGGQFSLSNGIAANRVASLQGAAWSAFGSGTDGPVRAAMAFDDDGAGPNPTSLFIGGTFSSIDGVPAVNVAKWDGSAWSPLSVGLPGLPFAGPGANAFEAFGDKFGSSLYIGGAFVVTPPVGETICGIARWDGAALQPVGGGINATNLGEVYALRVFDAGTGPALYAGGRFDNMGGLAVANIARWDGASWASVGTGVTGGATSWLSALEIHNDGSGPALYVAGRFTSAGGVAAANVARWSNGVWSKVGAGLTGSGSQVSALKVFDDGSGTALYAAGVFIDSGGVFVRNIARWNGTQWTALGGGLHDDAYALEVYDDGSGPALYIGGRFNTFTGFTSPGLVKWTSGGFAPSGGVGGASAIVHGLRAYDLGTGPALLVGGPFTMAGIQSVNNIARWSGSVWVGLGSGPNGAVRAMQSFDPDGAGPEASDLFAAGFFNQAGGVPASSIARWNGTAWTALGAGVTGGIAALTGFDDGSGPALYAAGSFTTAGGLAARGIARWSQTGWSLVGNGELNGSGTQAYTLAVYEGGAGPALYLGGEFPGIYNGVQVTQAKNIARWDGSQWSLVGEGMNGAVLDLAVLNSGSGPRLYACGGFTQSGLTPLARIGRWDGQTWLALGSGLNGGGSSLAAFEDALGPAVYVAGAFTQAGGMSAMKLGRWGCGPDLVPCYADCSGDGVLTVADFGCFQTSYVTADPHCDCNGDLVLTVADFGCFQTKFVVGCP